MRPFHYRSSPSSEKDVASAVKPVKIHVKHPQAYGIASASLSVGFIGGSQVILFPLRSYKIDRIFRFALAVQVLVSILFLITLAFAPYPIASGT